MKKILRYNQFINEIAEYHTMNDGDEADITIVKRDNNHDYEYCDGVLYEISNSGEDVIVSIDQVEHTPENTFYNDQIERYVEYISDGGILETFPVNESPLGGAYNLEEMLEYLDERENFDLAWDILRGNNVEYKNKKFYDDILGNIYNIEDYGIDEDILSEIRTVEDLDKLYNEKDYKERYYDEYEAEDDDGDRELSYSKDGMYPMFWNKDYYLGFKAILEHWKEEKEYTLTDMNHRFAALKELGKKRVYVDPS